MRNQMKLFIRNIIGPRSKTRVESIIKRSGLHPVVVEAGEVEIKEKLSFKNFGLLKEALLKEDFEVVTDRETIFLERIRNAVIEMIYSLKELPHVNCSAHLSRKLQVNYNYLSRFFSKV